MLPPDLGILDVGSAQALPPTSGKSLAEIWRDSKNNVSAHGYATRGRFWLRFPGIVSYSFDKHGRRVTAYRAPGIHEAVVRDIYRRSVVPMMLQVGGREVLHASAVLTRAGSIAFCGGAGAGKSTIAYGLSRRGYRQLSDDSVTFGQVDGEIHTLGLPFAVRLRPAPARYFGKPSKLRPPSIHADLEGEPGLSRPLRALFVLDRAPGSGAGEAVTIRKLSLAEFFTAVLPHAYCFTLKDAARKKLMIRHYLDIGSRVRTFAVRFRSGLKNLPSVLDRIEEIAARA